MQTIHQQQEAALNNVVSRVEQFRAAEQELMSENEGLQAQVAHLQKQNEQLSTENENQAEDLRTQLAQATASFDTAKADWQNTLRSMTEKHATVLEKYAHKKGEYKQLLSKGEKATETLAASEAKAAELSRRVAVLEGRAEEDAQKYALLVSELEQKQLELNVHVQRSAQSEQAVRSQSEKETSLRAALQDSEGRLR